MPKPTKYISSSKPAEYIRVSKDVYNSKCSTGEWTMQTPPVYWNGLAAVSMVKDKNQKDYKVIIVNYFHNLKTNKDESLN